MREAAEAKDNNDALNATAKTSKKRPAPHSDSEESDDEWEIYDVEEGEDLSRSTALERAVLETKLDDESFYAQDNSTRYRILQNAVDSIDVSHKPDLQCFKEHLSHLIKLGDSNPINRPYQLLRIVQFFLGVVGGHKNFVAELPTGTGKTVLFLLISYLFNQKTLLLVPKNSLGNQAVSRAQQLELSAEEKNIEEDLSLIKKALGEKKSHLFLNSRQAKERIPTADYYVTSYQAVSLAASTTYTKDSIIKKLPFDQIKLAIFDEAHNLQRAHAHFSRHTHTHRQKISDYYINKLQPQRYASLQRSHQRRDGSKPRSNRSTR